MAERSPFDRCDRPHQCVSTSPCARLRVDALPGLHGVPRTVYSHARGVCRPGSVEPELNGLPALVAANCSLTGLGDQAGPEPEAPAVTCGQHPRPPSAEQTEEALATLRQRARALRGCSPGERSRTFARRRAWPSPGGNRGVVDVLAGRPPGHRPAAGADCGRTGPGSLMTASRLEEREP
jgi:hypothetical protein